MADQKEELFSAIREGFDSIFSDDKFTKVALAAHQHQKENCHAIARISPAEIDSWKDIPLIPTRIFALHRIAAFQESQEMGYFLSSGTTHETQSRHFFRETDLYEAASMAGARWLANGRDFSFTSLIDDSDKSSLARMARFMQSEFSGRGDDAELVLGTAFSFVNKLDAGYETKLPEGSIIIETGGYKGKSREVSREDLHEMISEAYGVPRESIVSEYGMCEISSPFWQRPGEDGFKVPAWVRVRIVDPETLGDTDEGLIAIYDPANWDSSVGILTSDVGVLKDDRLFLKGRLKGAEAKGCSLAI